MNSPVPNDSPKPVSEHLRELRTRLIRASVFFACSAVVALFFSDDILRLLMIPLERTLPRGSHFIALGPMEAWLTQMKAALVAALFISSPAIFYEAWAFAAPAFEKGRRRRIAIATAASATMFLIGAIACYRLLLPYAFEYFVSAADAGGVVMMPGIASYLGFILTALVALGLVFQIPLLTGFLAAWNIVPIETLCRIRKYVIVAAFIVAAIATPPDALSQIAVAIPLIVLYEISILSVKIFGKKRRDQCLQVPPAQQPADRQ